MKKLLLILTISLCINHIAAQDRGLFVIKMDEEMQFKKVRGNDILSVKVQHKKFPVKHIYLFKVDRKNIFQVKKKSGKIIKIVELKKTEIYTRKEIRRMKPPVLDQTLKNMEHLLLMNFKNFDTQHYWQLEYIGSTVER